MLKRNNALSAGAALAVGLLASCYPSGPSDVGETDVAVTAFDSTRDFSAIRTWAMPDEVFVTEGSDADVTDQFDDLILDQVAKNMTALGYVRETNPQANGADVVVIVRKSKQTSTGWVGGGSPGWCGWPGWGYPGWGCWPGYYPWIPVSFTTGSVIVEMYDPNEGASAEELRGIWGALLNGLASGSSGSNASRISQGIDQAFAQSPYLGRR
jgi:hypothetical protein